MTAIINKQAKNMPKLTYPGYKIATKVIIIFLLSRSLQVYQSISGPHQ